MSDHSMTNLLQRRYTIYANHNVPLKLRKIDLEFYNILFSLYISIFKRTRMKILNI